MKRIIVIVLVLVFVLSPVAIDNTKVEAKATKKAMKFLKGTWVSWGHSQSTKVIFTKKYMLWYDLGYMKGNEYKVKSPKRKGKYTGKSRIVSTKKKGKKWIIKVKSRSQYTYYKGKGDVLECWWKENGEWMFSGTSSYERYSRKVYK